MSKYVDAELIKTEVWKSFPMVAAGICSLIDTLQSDTQEERYGMKLIIDITEYNKEWIGNLHFIPEELKVEIGNAIMKGTPFDSVIEDIKAEIIDKYMSADGKMGKVSADILKIIDKHISGKESE